MAFSTIQGSGGAPDSFVGTSGVDSISLINSSGNFFLGAQGDNDVISFVRTFLDAGVISSATARGGDGNDLFLSSNGAAVFNSVFFNGNAGTDTFTITAGLLSASTLQGGQGEDIFTIGSSAVSSLINGNRDNDTITLQTVAISASSIFGGQGDDTINVNIATTTSAINGDDGDDNITSASISIVGTSFAGGAGTDTINLTLVGSANGGVLIDGGDGNDVLTGTAGSDTISGDANRDTLTGGAGADTLSGGPGQNAFNYGLTANIATFTGTTTETVDVITDFTTGVDRLIFLTPGTGNFAVGSTTYATLAAAVAAPNTAQIYNVVAVGAAATGFTAFLLIDTTAGAATPPEGAIQLGVTNAFATAALATASIVAGDIVAA